MALNRMTYAEAMRRFGSDKPDLRIALELVDVAEQVKGCEFAVFTNAANDFTGDVTMLAGNLSAGAVLGGPANKLILKGGALFVSGGAVATTTFGRNIEVSAASGIGTNATVSGVQALQLTGTLSGSGNLTRYAPKVPVSEALCAR